MSTRWLEEKVEIFWGDGGDEVPAEKGEKFDNVTVFVGGEFSGYWWQYSFGSGDRG